MLTHNLGYPRIGSQRELKKASEKYWSGQLTLSELQAAARHIAQHNWQLQQEAGLDLIPCNDFSYYDQVLDTSLMVGAIPRRYTPVLSENPQNTAVDLYFAMARGYQRNGLDITAMEMTKWFDTNYHYLVPEFTADQEFRLFSEHIFDQFIHARNTLSTTPKPVLLGPVSYLLLGKEKEEGFHRIELLKRLLPVYVEVLTKLHQYGATWVQLDEPYLALDLTSAEKDAYLFAYAKLARSCPGLKLLVATYFEGLRDNAELAVSLPISALHLDLVRAPEQLDAVLPLVPQWLSLSLGVVDGRNIWKNDYQASLALLEKAVAALGTERVLLAPSCSLLHSPCDLDLETNDATLTPEIKNWLAFAKQKLREVEELRQIADHSAQDLLRQNQQALDSRRKSERIHRTHIKERTAAVTEADARRRSPFAVRQARQQEHLQLPLFPTTTIGSFPQTEDIRQLRARFKKGELSSEQYDEALQNATIDVIRWQEEVGLDVLVHGEFERNDMVEYFGELLDGFAFTKNGWVQSYGSRCVKPPVLYGDIHRPQDMTVAWSTFAQAQTQQYVKGMLTGPVTILQWSFVRDDQPRATTALQIALAIREEVLALEKAGIQLIQIDEPAIREGLPLRRSDWPTYLAWAVQAFRVAAAGVRDETQIHTHMCYSEFNEILPAIAELDADVITMETSRSQMELLAAFADFQYPNQIGPGVYDIHSPRVPSTTEMVALLEKAQTLLPAENLWVNPDCGLKTRKWPETEAALRNMVQAAYHVRARVGK
ncbi:5-methyltetrahydropteroyltriglutamate--homocysteine S-methyltransferase [Hymenobacter aerilatus]|uniref:5-methyltetrahydropteroyltriglutamate--homocysteine methyltransferase n=1 Tax=Hymenobacter aerilatus TaxID=2932251 RepID=A0A8T9T018_9BACT|nr:5-methyltetrahydropteroyltriglutamate--homocysteine S-methyltransferase [Hymenobacter aerilatus]UOR05830.1 5-methyltetrahydropteroyltriglutamate--homocysteine S-methyltransferase [Hymenobacter aerilatus]